MESFYKFIKESKSEKYIGDMKQEQKALLPSVHENMFKHELERHEASLKDSEKHKNLYLHSLKNHHKTGDDKHLEYAAEHLKNYNKSIDQAKKHLESAQHSTKFTVSSANQVKEFKKREEEAKKQAEENKKTGKQYSHIIRGGLRDRNYYDDK